jgi:hypothetical protein
MLHAWQEKGSGMPLWLASFWERTSGAAFHYKNTPDPVSKHSTAVAASKSAEGKINKSIYQSNLMLHFMTYMKLLATVFTALCC